MDGPFFLVRLFWHRDPPPDAKLPSFSLSLSLVSPTIDRYFRLFVLCDERGVTHRSFLDVDRSIHQEFPYLVWCCWPRWIAFATERGINDRNEAHNSIFLHLALPPVVLGFRLWVQRSKKKLLSPSPRPVYGRWLPIVFLRDVVGPIDT